ncbi:MAG: aminopeptidase [Hespellia sp.]|nr:aminopeptidase [Hespellia sp.]
MEFTEEIKERYDLTVERISQIPAEESAGEQFRDYFTQVSRFILKIDEIYRLLNRQEWETLSLAQKKAVNQELYEDILESNYEKSYANPSVAVQKLGPSYGQLLCFLYTEIRSEIPYAFEENIEYLSICNELFLEIYTCFEGDDKPLKKTVKDILYWYVSDYCDVFQADRVLEQIDPMCTFATDIILNADLDDDAYLYRFGEYITENELGTAAHLRSLPQETLQKMADVYTEGYRIGFVNTGKDLSKKSTVNIRYSLGFEKVIRLAIENFKKMGLAPTIYRAASSVITKREQYKIGYCGAIANKQYEYDHRSDQGLFLDKKLVERKLEVTKNTFEQYRELAAGFAGPAVMEIFGERPFVPANKTEAVSLTDAQKELSVLYDNKSGQLTNQYIKGEERSFTIVAYPVPEIGEKYGEIFDEVIRINTLDAKVYEKVQQTLIDALDQGEYVHILGKDDNKTNLKVQLRPLSNPEKETKFENCVADVNIPVGEAFTSPVLEGTDGILFVSRVYLNELQYQNLKITFQDGKITDYSCTNFDTEQQNRDYIRDNILHSHETLPIGEFAIGTNTTAYVTAKNYGIEEKMPILIAEKMGPHFAVGDTCYSWSEDIRVYNPNGKEIIAKDNSISSLRKEDVSKAYFGCHTDITIPYEELESICVVTKEGKDIILLKDGRFVLNGTEILNKPFDELIK